MNRMNKPIVRVGNAGCRRDCRGSGEEGRRGEGVVSLELLRSLAAAVLRARDGGGELGRACMAGAGGAGGRKSAGVPFQFGSLGVAVARSNSSLGGPVRPFLGLLLDRSSGCGGTS